MGDTGTMATLLLSCKGRDSRSGTRWHWQKSCASCTNFKISRMLNAATERQLSAPLFLGEQNRQICNYLGFCCFILFCLYVCLFVCFNKGDSKIKRTSSSVKDYCWKLHFCISRHFCDFNHLSVAKHQSRPFLSI